MSVDDRKNHVVLLERIMRTPFHARLDANYYHQSSIAHDAHVHGVPHGLGGRGFGHWLKHAFRKVGHFLAPIGKEALHIAGGAAVSALTGGAGGSLVDNLKNAAMTAGKQALAHEAAGIGGGGPAPHAVAPAAAAPPPAPAAASGAVAGFGVPRRRKAPAKRKKAVRRPY